MQGEPSFTSTWETLELPTYMSKEIYCQARISDNESLILYEAEEPVIGFVIFNFKKREFSRVRIENADSEFNKIIYSRYMLCEGNIVVLLEQTSELRLWKFKIFQDKGTISGLSKYSYPGFGNSPKNIAVMYKQNIYIQVFILLSEHEKNWASKETKKEQLLAININTGSMIELKVPGSYTPAPRKDYFTVLNQNQLFVFGGQIPAQSSEVKFQSHTSIIWALDLDKLKWRSISCELSPLPRSGGLACSFGNSIYVFGGDTNTGSSSSLFRYDIATNNWRNLQNTNRSLEVSSDRKDSFVVLKGGFLLQQKDDSAKKKNYYARETDIIMLLTLENLEEKCECIKGTRSYDISLKQKYLYEQKPFSDIIFKVEQQEILAHKGVLSAGCRFFENMFTSGMEETTNKVIDVPGIKFEVFEAILQYVYCSTVNINEDIAWDLFKTSDKYLLPDLRDMCEEFLIDDIKAANVVQVINLADEYEAEKLKKAAKKYIADNMDLVFEVADIYQLKKATLLEICKMKP